MTLTTLLNVTCTGTTWPVVYEPLASDEVTPVTVGPTAVAVNDWVLLGTELPLGLKVSVDVPAVGRL